MDPIASLNARIHMMSFAWCILGPFQSIPKNIDQRSIFIDVLINDQTSKDIRKELKVAEEGYQKAKLHIALATEKLYERAWCMFEIAIRAEAKKKTEIIFLRNTNRTGHEAMEENDISALLTFLVIFFRAAIVPYVTYGFAYSVLLVFYRIDLAESNSLAAFGSATTGLQMVSEYCWFLDFGSSFKKISDKYARKYGLYDEMESFKPSDLVEIKKRILQIFGLGESFDIKILSASVRSSASQIEMTLIFWLEPILWLLAAPFHILVSPLALIVACCPWSCPVRHVEYRNIKGDQIVSGSWDNTCIIWDAATGDEILQLKGHSISVQSVAWSPKGDQIVSASYSTLIIWDAATGEEISLLVGHTKTVTSVAWSPKGDQIVSGSIDNTCILWDVATGETRFHKISELKGHVREIKSVAWSPRGDQILSGSRDNMCIIWDAVTGVKISQLEGHSSAVLSVAWSPKGDQIVSGSSDKTCIIWDATTGDKVSELKGHTYWVNSVAWSPKGDFVVSGAGNTNPLSSYPGEIFIWDASTGEKVSSLTGHTKAVTSVAWSPKGYQIVSGSSDKTCIIWDAITGDKVSELKGNTHWVNSVAWSPQGAMSPPAARFLDRWLFADGILKFALLGPIVVAALLSMALLWALGACLRALCAVRRRVDVRRERGEGKTAGDWTRKRKGRTRRGRGKKRREEGEEEKKKE
jgi:WD40 repeat protein